MRFHNLRHSAATFLLAMGVHVKIVQELSLDAQERAVA
jgi:site-specific recombinase XerD